MSYFGDDADSDSVTTDTGTDQTPLDPTTDPDTDGETTDTGSTTSKKTTPTPTATTGDTGGTTPAGPVLDGRYEGSIVIHYESLIPLIGGSARCDGDAELVVDQTATEHVSGTFECTWPPLNLWAALTLNAPIGGTLAGNVNPVTFEVLGDVGGNDFGVVGKPWVDSFDGFTVKGTSDLVLTFERRTFLTEDYEGEISVTWVGP
ncbi:MAG: hypothetical protein KTR31_37560 [Myxococcales bacterium]|nr:hypothetical protein [Myxococcales bacterium]